MADTGTKPSAGQSLRELWVALQALLLSAGPIVVLAIGLVVAAFWWLQPNPPTTVRLATGPAQSAYDEFGRRYAAHLAAHGIQVEQIATEGSQDNLRRLQEGSVDLGFVQGGSDDLSARRPDEQTDALLTLGNLFLEPIWVFYREASLPAAAPRKAGAAEPPGLARFKGLRINIGTAGSGGPALVNRLLDINRIDGTQMRLSYLAATPAVVAFLGQELDVLVFVSAPEAPMVQMLLQTPGVRLASFAQSEAYARRLRFLSPVVLPRGVVDLAADLPAEDVRLVATTTSLLARDGTHPALLQLFSQAATTLHGGAGWFNRAREFPNAAHSERNLAREAERQMTGGPPWLQRYLPFWLANLVERMWLVLGLILAIVLPLSRIVPPLYDRRIRSRVFRWYAQLRGIEDALAAGVRPQGVLLNELDELDRHVATITVPLSHADELYALRQHIELIRSRYPAQ